MTVLEKICRMAEEFVPGSLAGVTILDRAGHIFEGCVMPSAPSFAAAIAGIEVGPPHAGTCAAAVYSGMPVSSTDVGGGRALRSAVAPAQCRARRALHQVAAGEVG